MIRPESPQITLNHQKRDTGHRVAVHTYIYICMGLIMVGRMGLGWLTKNPECGHPELLYSLPRVASVGIAKRNQFISQCYVLK